MAMPENEPKPSERDESSDSSNSSDSESDSEQATQVEWLATGRAKRSTAGNRMKGILANEEPADDDSDLELLFAEDEDDAGFSDHHKDDGSDVQMDSSSDDEGDAQGKDDDLEGEKELERKEREKKAAARKRKAQEAIPVKFRKKVRISQPATGATVEDPKPRPKKKSERLSWLPSTADAPTRASERATTKISKAHLHEQMVERERRRMKQLEMMEKKAKKAEAMKKPPMTQEQRLAEAATVEKRNSKSLNRWEVAERQREEERQKKLAAMYNRTLEGPVVTFWSGILELDEEQMKNVGKMVTMEEKAPRKKRQSTLLKEAEKAKLDAAASPSTSTPSEAPQPPKIEGEQAANPSMAGESLPPTTNTPSEAQAEIPLPPDAPGDAAEPKPGLAAPHLHLTEAVFMPIGPPLESPRNPSPEEPRPSSSSVLAPPLSMLALAPPPGAPQNLPIPNSTGIANSNILAPPNTSHTPSPLSMPPQTPSTASVAPSMPPPPPPIPKVASSEPVQTPTPVPPVAEETPSEPPQEPPKEPDTPLDGRITRSCIILQNFDENAVKDRHVQTQILFGRKMNKVGKTQKPGHAPLCVITNHPARYRDPKTLLPFYSTRAYKEIQKLNQGDYKWSRLLGAWSGTGTAAARGVPASFLGGPKEDKPAEPGEEAAGTAETSATQEEASGQDAKPQAPAETQAQNQTLAA